MTNHPAPSAGRTALGHEGRGARVHERIADDVATRVDDVDAKLNRRRARAHRVRCERHAVDDEPIGKRDARDGNRVLPVGELDRAGRKRRRRRAARSDAAVGLLVACVEPPELLAVMRTRMRVFTSEAPARRSASSDRRGRRNCSVPVAAQPLVAVPDRRGAAPPADVRRQRLALLGGPRHARLLGVLRRGRRRGCDRACRVRRDRLLASAVRGRDAQAHPVPDVVLREHVRRAGRTRQERAVRAVRGAAVASAANHWYA